MQSLSLMPRGTGDIVKLNMLRSRRNTTPDSAPYETPVDHLLHRHADDQPLFAWAGEGPMEIVSDGQRTMSTIDYHDVLYVIFSSVSCTMHSLTLGKLQRRPLVHTPSTIDFQGHQPCSQLPRRSVNQP